jgi:hypothetical protein
LQTFCFKNKLNNFSLEHFSEEDFFLLKNQSMMPPVEEDPHDDKTEEENVKLFYCKSPTPVHARIQSKILSNCHG